MKRRIQSGVSGGLDGGRVTNGMTVWGSMPLGARSVSYRRVLDGNKGRPRSVFRRRSLPRVGKNSSSPVRVWR